MGTQHPDLFAALMAPFDNDQIRTRPGGQGRNLQYITARTVANRLDDVLGPERWDFEVSPWGEGALIGTLILRLPDGTVVRKSNVGGKADMQADDDDTKSAASDCLKRCAALLGIGRYLYNDGVPEFAKAAHQNVTRPGTPVNTRSNPDPRDRPPAPDRGQGSAPRNFDGQAPRTGKQLFAWCMDQQDNKGVKNVLRDINGLGQKAGLPERMVQWKDDDVALIHGQYAGGERA